MITLAAMTLAKAIGGMIAAVAFTIFFLIAAIHYITGPD
jgi:hypothetical protein